MMGPTNTTKIYVRCDYILNENSLGRRRGSDKNIPVYYFHFICIFPGFNSYGRRIIMIIMIIMIIIMIIIIMIIIIID